VYEAFYCSLALGETLLVLCDGSCEIKDAQGNFMEFEAFEQFMRQHVADGLRRNTPSRLFAPIRRLF